MKRINVIGKTAEKIVVTDKPQEQIDPVEFAKAIGAEPTGTSIPKNADIITLAEIGIRELKKGNES